MEENKSVQVNAQSEQNHGNEDLAVKFSPEELTERLKATAAEAKKYRQDKAAIKSQLEETQKQLEALKKQSFESQGNYKALYEEIQGKLQETESKYKTQIGRYALNVVESSVKEQLLMAKCQRPDAILKLCQDNIRSFELDEGFKPNPTEVKSLVEEAMKQYPEWFKQETPKFQDAAPIGKMPEKPLAAMSTQELIAHARELDKHKRS